MSKLIKKLNADILNMAQRLQLRLIWVVKLVKIQILWSSVVYVDFFCVKW